MTTAELKVLDAVGRIDDRFGKMTASEQDACAQDVFAGFWNYLKHPTRQGWRGKDE